MDKHDQMTEKKETRKFRRLLFENKRIVLLIEVFVGVLAVLLSIFARIYAWEDFTIGIFDNLFTACLIAIVASVINWNVQDEYEKTLHAVKEESEKRIEESDRLVKMLQETTVDSVQKLESISQRTETVLSSYFSRNCLFCKTCMIGVYPNRRESKLDEFFRNANKEINILVTNLESIKDYSPILLAKAQQGIPVKICTIDPRSARVFNITRVTGGNSNPKTRFDSMRNSLSFFLEKNEGLLSNAQGDKTLALHNEENAIQIKTYSIMPTMILFVADNECIIAFMLNNSFARDVIHLHFKLDVSFFDDNAQVMTPMAFKDHFDTVFRAGDYICEKDVDGWEYTEE